MKSKAILIFIMMFSSFSILSAQIGFWNVHHQNDLAQTTGSQLIETDSFYYNLGMAYDTFPTRERGVFITKIDKNSGKNIAYQYYGEMDTYFSFTTLRNVILDGEYILVPVTIGFSDGVIHLYKVNINTLKFEKMLNIPSPEVESSFLFLLDFLEIGEYYYLLNIIQTEEFNEPLVIKIKKQDLSIQYIRIKDKKENITSFRFSKYGDGLLIYSMFYEPNIVAGGRLITYIDLDGKVIWESKSPSFVPNFYILSVLPINDHEVLINADDAIYDFAINDIVSRHSVMRFDLNTKKSVWHTWWDEPRIENLFSQGILVEGHKKGEILMMSNDVYSSEAQDTTYYLGKVIKFDLSGKKIWQKKYSYYLKNNFSNNFYNMIATKDGNYLICGFENQYYDAWLVKIDEDGNILPIDTTSSTGDIYSTTISLPEIKVYPNPASNTIIINQGEISDMTYLLTDIHGLTIKSMPLPDAHHHVVWDISDVVSGTYVLQMRQCDKVIGTKQIVVVK